MVKKTQKSHTNALYIIAVLSVTVVIGFLISHAANLSSRLDSAKAEVSMLQNRLAENNIQLCSNSPDREAGTTQVFSIESSGGTRSYRVHTPSDFTSNVRYPVVVAFDGINGFAANIEQYAGLNELPAIIVYPEPILGKGGITAWQGAPYSAAGVSDVQFLSDTLQQVSSDYCTDSTRTFLVGMSNGGGFAWLAGCYLSDKIAGVATISGAHYSSCPNQKRPIPVLAIHSEDDANVLFKGDTRRGLPATTAWTGARAKANSCGTQPTISRTDTFTKLSWSSCSQSAGVELLSFHSQPHGWLQTPNTNPDRNFRQKTTAQYIWDFFTAQQGT